MVSIGNGAGRKTIGVVTDMDQPLGLAVGNALEVKEAIDTLKGEGPEDFVELCLTLGSYMLLAGGKASTPQEARAMLTEVIDNGKALQKLADFVAAQGGNPQAVYDTTLLPQASILKEVPATEDGYITHIACDEVGICSLILGGGRETKESVIDLSVGIILAKKKDDYVRKGEPIAIIHGNDEEKINQAMERLQNAYLYSETPGHKSEIIKGIVE